MTFPITFVFTKGQAAKVVIFILQIEEKSQTILRRSMGHVNTNAIPRGTMFFFLTFFNELINI